MRDFSALRLALFASIVWLLNAVTARAAEQTVTLAGLKVTVWSDATSGTVKQLVIIFSHGFHGCATQSRFLMEAFASAGYIVFAPNHHDATCNGGETSWLSAPALRFRQPNQWNETTYRDRAGDIRNLIDAIKADGRFRNRVDWSRLGLAGHSLGGYTVLGLAGAWPEWKLPGVKAVLALSPYSQPFLSHGTLANLSAPVMYQGGTRDFGITPALDKPMGTYDQSPQPKYFVEFDQAGHFAWTNFPSSVHQDIAVYAVAFMNHYVKGEKADPVLTRALPDVVQFRYASEIGSSATSGGARSAIELPRFRAPG
jgi:predicted dienelactone hydrolase